MFRYSLVRFSICALCCFALIQFGVVDTPQAHAQGGRVDGPPGEDGGARGSRTSSRQSSQRNSQTKTSGKAKFENLLEEKDLSLFRGYKSEDIGDGWAAEGKTLHLDGEGGDLVTLEEYDNFDLRFDFKVSEGANSGVMYRVSLGDNATYFSGPEYQILDDENHVDGESDLTSAGSVYGLYAPNESELKDVGRWNTARIVVEGDEITHYLNGSKVVEATMGSDDWEDRVSDSKFKTWEKYGANDSGHIAFQDHGDEVWYRNIRVKRLAGVEEEAAAQRMSKMELMRQQMMSADGKSGARAEDDDKGKKKKDQSSRRNRRQPPSPGGGL